VIVARLILSSEGVHRTSGSLIGPQYVGFAPVLGISRSKQATNPPDRADALADIVLPDHEGNDVRLGDLWQDGPAVLVWLRHYG
jgi:hypothetical protein